MNGSKPGTVFAPLALYGNRYPLPAASFATGTPVRLLPENSIIHNHKYLALCVEVLPRTAALLSPCAPVGVSLLS